MGKNCRNANIKTFFILSKFGTRKFINRQFKTLERRMLPDRRAPQRDSKADAQQLSYETRLDTSLQSPYPRPTISYHGRGWVGDGKEMGKTW